MNHRSLSVFSSLLLVMVVGLGCEKKESAPATPTGAAQGSSPVESAAKAVSDGAKSAVDSGKAAVSDAAKAVTDTGSAAVAKATEGASALATQAQSLLDQVSTNVKEKKWELADDGLKKLEGMKPQLSADWAGKVDQARKLYDTAKGAAGSLPAMPAMPGAAK